MTDILVSVLAARGFRHQVRGEYDAALRCYQSQQTIAEMIGDQAGIAGAWLNFGMLKGLHDDNEQALLLFQKALALYEAGGIKRGVALTLGNLSRLYSKFADYGRAFDCAQRALRLYEGMNHRRGMEAALSNLAYVYGAQNNSEQALAYLERAMMIAQELGDPIQIATLRNDIAAEHKELGNYDRALEIYLELLNQIGGFGDRGGAAVIRDQIGSIFAAQNKYADALNYYRQALAELETVNNKSEMTAALNGMSNVYLAQGKYAEALPLAEQAVALSRQTGGQLGLWLALTTLGSGQLGLHRPLEARQAFTEAVSIIEKLRTQTAGGVEDRRRYFEGRLRAHHGLLNLMVNEGQKEEALVLAEQTKARVLVDVLSQGRVSIQKTMTAQEQEQERQLKLELTQLNTQLTTALQSDKPDAERIRECKLRLEKARLNFEAFQTSLYAMHPELKIDRGDAPTIKAEELTALLPNAASALLEYVVTDDRTYLFIITTASVNAPAEVRVYPLSITRDEIAKQIEFFRQQLAARNLGFRASAARLYALLLKPAQTQLRGKTNLIIAPDDKLWDLPFQALLTGANRFLIEDAAIAYTPSLTVLREMTKRRKQRGDNPASATLLALGNPLVGKETVSRAALTLRDEKLEPLPEAEQEVKALGRLYGTAKSKIYIGAEAREDRVKSEAGQAGILHFATHGMLNNASPMYSHLILAQGNTNEDGLLEAWELTQLDLKADLAVLSACETARGRFGAGEGMIGLSWALFIAGVPATVVSQWKVESASTRDLMLGFHRQMMSPSTPTKPNMTKAEALRQAALKLMKAQQTSHPFYWAGFVLIGDGR